MIVMNHANRLLTPLDWTLPARVSTIVNAVLIHPGRNTCALALSATYLKVRQLQEADDGDLAT